MNITDISINNLDQLDQTVEHKTNKVVASIFKFSQVILGIFLGAIAFNLLAKPNFIVNGGISGIAIILNKTINLPVDYFMYPITAILLVSCYFLLGKQTFMKIVLGSIIFPISISLTANITKYIVISSHDLLLISVFIGVLYGVANGLVHRHGYSSGGSEIIGKIMAKYLRIPYSRAIAMFDIAVVLAGAYYIGFTRVLYAFVIIFIVKNVFDQVMLGISGKKVFYIMTDKATEVMDFIHNELGYDITLFDADSNITKKNQNVILTIVGTSDYYRLKEGIHEIDPEAFFMIMDEFEHHERAGKHKHEVKIKCIEEENYENI